jgi:hypothetical protein
MERMTVDYDDLRAKALAATPGPWETPTGDCVWSEERLVARGDDERPFVERAANTAFIAAANPVTVLSLLDEIAALKAALQEK